MSIDIERRSAVWPHMAILLGMASAAVAGVLLMTRWGVGASPDSAHYVHAARQLLGEPGGSFDSSELALTHFAPFYPMLLAIGGPFGIDPLDTARWLNAVLFGCNAMLVGLLATRAVRQSHWLAVVASLVMAGSMPALTVHATALSEPVFLAATLAGLYLLTRYDESARVSLLTGAAVAMGIAALTRYAGAACVLAGLVVVWLSSEHALRRRLWLVSLFGIISGGPLLLWLARNMAVAGAATDRELSFHPVGLAQAWQAVYTVSGWLAIPPQTPGIVRLGIVFLLCVATILILMRSRGVGRPLPAAVRAVAVFIASYALFLAVSMSLFDANTPLDDRILLPIFAAGLIVAAYSIAELLPLLEHRPVVAFCAACSAMFLLTAHMTSGVSVVLAGYTSGWGLTSRAWRDSATVAEIQKLPPESTIYSNAPEIIYLHTRRISRPIPKRTIAMRQEDNAQFSIQWARVEQELRAACGVVVYFRRLASSSSLSEAELIDGFSLRVVADRPDGTILGDPRCLR